MSNDNQTNVNPEAGKRRKVLFGILPSWLRSRMLNMATRYPVLAA